MSDETPRERTRERNFQERRNDNSNVMKKIKISFLKLRKDRYILIIYVW